MSILFFAFVTIGLFGVLCNIADAAGKLFAHY